MAPRAYCKGRLKVSLVFCATKLHPATTSERVRFPPSHHQHSRMCGGAVSKPRPVSERRRESVRPGRSPRGRWLTVKSAAWRLMDLAQSRQMLCVTARGRQFDRMTLQ
jgi:hypothetical protein